MKKEKREKSKKASGFFHIISGAGLMIELSNVSKSYVSKNGKETKALRNVSLSFGGAGVTFILGKSGSGKSTLLNILGGLDTFDSGGMTVAGKNFRNFSQSELDAYRNEYVGFVFQEFNLLDDYDVAGNISLALLSQGKSADGEKIDGLLDMLGLNGLGGRNINELSGGQKQRVAIARSLVKDPKIILADEPTGNLDSASGRQVMDILREIGKERAVIIVSHDVALATAYGDRIVELKDGEIVSDTGNIAGDGERSEPFCAPRYRLAAKESFRLGAGSLKLNKVRLIFTVLLTVCTLILASLLDSLSAFDTNRAHAKLLNEREVDFLTVEKYAAGEPGVPLPMDPPDIEKIRRTAERSCFPLYRLEGGGNGFFTEVAEILHIAGDLAGATRDARLVADDEFLYLKKTGTELLGKIPSGDGEIVISDYAADYIIENGIELSDGELYRPADYRALVNDGKELPFAGNSSAKISGVLLYPLEKYRAADRKNDEGADLTDDDNRALIEHRAKEGSVYNLIFTTGGFIDNLTAAEKRVADAERMSFKFSSDTADLKENMPQMTPATANPEYYDGERWVTEDAPDDGEVVLNIKQLNGYNESDYRAGLRRYINENPELNRQEAEREFFAEYVKKMNFHGTVNLTVTGGGEIKKYEGLKIAGVTGLLSGGAENYFYLPPSVLPDSDGSAVRLNAVFIPAAGRKPLNTLLDRFSGDETFAAVTAFDLEVSENDRIMRTIKKIIAPVSAVFLIFAVLLIANFTAAGVSSRKKEIGILRGLGATGKDVAGIFLCGSAVLAIASFVPACAGLAAASGVLNGEISGSGFLSLSPFIPSFRQFAVMFVLSYLITAVACIVPLRRISKMKPVDAIAMK